MSCAAKTPNIEHTRNNSLFAKFEFPPPWQTTRQVFHHLVFSIDQSRGTSHLHSGEGRNIRLSAKWTRMGTSRARQPFGSQVVHSTVRFYHREWERKSCGLTMGAGRKSGISQNGPEGRETRSPTIWIPDGRFHRQDLPLGMGAEELRADDGSRGDIRHSAKWTRRGARHARQPSGPQTAHSIIKTYCWEWERKSCVLTMGARRNIRLSAKWTRMGARRARQPLRSQMAHSIIKAYHWEWGRKSCVLTIGFAYNAPRTT